MKLDLAESARGDDVAGLLEVRPTALLHAGLHDAFGVGYGRQQRLAFVDGVRDRLFHVDVFAGVHGVDGHGNVPMIRCADYDSVDIGRIEDFAVVEELARFGRHLFAGLGAVQFVDIADGYDLAAADFVEHAEQVLTASAGADTADADTIVSAEDAAVRSRGGPSRGFEKVTPVWHVTS